MRSWNESERWMFIMLGEEKSLKEEEWVEGKRHVITQQSTLLTISIFWNVTKESELPRKSKCEISWKMKDLYWYRK